MTTGRKWFSSILVAALGFGIGMFASGRGGFTPRSEAVSLFGDGAATAPAASPPAVSIPDFADLADHMAPSVVNISTTQEVRGGGGGGGPSGGGFGGPGGGGGPGGPGGGGGGGDDDQFHEFFGPFEKFFGPQGKGGKPYKAKSLGSGFIIDTKGSILTNNHVVENADEIVVRLKDGTEHKAKVVGRDAKTDIALIEIHDAQNLQALPLGDSDILRVGQWVVAIGNPFGLESSVTAGIVSALSRHINQGPYDNFIQTDAAINPGNSGGPLLNTRGDVVGINTAIYSRSGGNIGIGFAIPINLAKDIVRQLKEKGKVTRGWLGVMIQKVTPEIAESLGLTDAKGALVADVVKDGPAEAAGIKQGDVITEFDGKPVTASDELPLLVARTGVGKTVPLTLLRGKEKMTLQVRIDELKEEDDGNEHSESGGNDTLGLNVQTLTPELAENLGLDRNLKGVVVSQVDPNGSAGDAGLRRGDVILEVNRNPVKDLAAYKKAVRETGKNKSVLFLVKRGDNTIFLAVKPSS